MNGLQKRITEARCLIANGHSEGGLILALIAFAGLSRKRYPKNTRCAVYFQKKRQRHPDQMKQIEDEERKSTKNKRKYANDNQAFKCLVFDEIGKILTYDYPPERRLTTNVVLPTSTGNINFEDMLYRWLRCPFVHEAELTGLIQFHKSAPGINSISLSNPMSATENWWSNNILRAIEESPELASQCPSDNADVAGHSDSTNTHRSAE